MSFEFNFKNIINMKKPDYNIFSIPSISDDLLYNFNPERYQFYLKFIQGLSDTDTLKKFYYKNTDIKYNNEKRQKIINNILKSLKLIYNNNKKDDNSKISSIITNKLENILKNKIENNDKALDSIKNTFKIETVGGDGFLKNPIYEHPIEDFNNDINNLKSTNNINKESLNKIYNKYEDNLKTLEITLNDRIVFIITTFILRFISLTLIEWSLNANLINNFLYAFIYYCIIYIIFFNFIILIVNVIFYYPVMQLYNDSSIFDIQNMLYYFYIYSNGYSRLLLHMVIILLLMIIPFVINYSDNNENENNNNNNSILNKKILNTLSTFSLIIWILTSLVSLIF